MKLKLKKDIYFVIKYLLYAAGTLFLSAIIGAAIFLLIDKNKGQEKLNNEIIPQIERLEDVNESYIDRIGDVKIVDGFDVYKDTLPFDNYVSENTRGVCKGYAIFEILNFENKLDSAGVDFKVTKDLCEYNLDVDDISKVYCDKDIYTNEVTEQAATWDRIGNIKEESIKDILKKDNNKDKEKYDNFSDKEFNNQETKELLQIISDLQHDETYYSKSNEYYIGNWICDFKYTRNKSFKTISPENIKRRLDNNELVAVGMTSENAGHAVLCYGYSIIDDENIKFFISDSNFPITNLGEEAWKSFYILFTKNVDDEWHYIYEPVINDKKICRDYNSYIPSSSIGLYDTDEFIYE